METNAAPESGLRPAGETPGTRPELRRLSQELTGLQTRFAEQPVTLQEVIVVLRGRAYLLLLILLALPFCTPIPLPGFSTPFGFVIAVIALRLTLGQRPWLPDKLLQKQLPAGFFGRLLTAAARIIQFCEVLLRPRWTLLTDLGLMRQTHALVMLIAVLLLPLPIPFSNTFPAWVILLIAGGLMERDGAAIVLGYAVFAAGVLYFVFLGGATHHLIDAFKRLLAE